MAWTWDSYRAEAGWGQTVTEPRRQDSLRRFMLHVDRMLIVASVALIFCLASLVVG